VAHMRPFIVTRFIRQSASGQAYSSGQAYHSQYVLNDTAYDSVLERQSSGDELTVYGGMHIEASDGKVGKRIAQIDKQGEAGAEMTEVPEIPTRAGRGRTGDCTRRVSETGT
jgi:hypothetical protein